MLHCRQSRRRGAVRGHDFVLRLSPLISFIWSKCDQQQPSCGQCTGSNLVCEGYDRARIFVNSSQEHGDANLCRFMPKSYAPLPLTQSRPWTLPRLQPRVLALPLPLTLERSLERTAFESRYCELYWASLLPNGEAFSPRAARYSTAGWTGVVQDLSHRDDMVRLALLANALRLLGQHSGQESIMIEGCRMYGRSLQLLALSLPAAGPETRDKLLTTSLMLAQYEVRLTLYALRGVNIEPC